MLTALDDRFSKSAIIASSMLDLVPSVLCCQDASLNVNVQEYKDDLPSPELLFMEARRWKARYSNMPENLKPASPAQVIENCDVDMFPNIFVLKIACTIPVTSCECERSASALRSLHTYIRAMMTTDRLSSLALLNVHYDTAIDLDNVVTLFAQLHPHRLERDPVQLLH